MAKDTGRDEKAAHEQLRQLATVISESCYATAVTAYEDARIDGLCHDGAWELALEAIRAIDIDSIPSSYLFKP